MKLFLKKFLLIILGIFLSLVILECGLRVSGWTISFYQQYKNNKALRNKSQYTIMCLGESTTQSQYPIQLQEILDEKYPNKFSVIDCGVTSTHLELILNNIDKNINKYKPDIAICMMGINDMLYVYNNINNFHTHKNIFISKFKIYKFFILLKKHISSLLKTDLLYADNSKNINYIIEELEKNFFSNNYKNVILLSEKLLKENKINDYEKIYFYYINSLNQYSDKCYDIDYSITKEEFFEYKQKIVELSKNLINKNIKDKSLLETCYWIIFKYGNKDEKVFYVNNLVTHNLHIINSNLYFLIKDYIKDKQKEKILNFLSNSSNDIIYGFFAINTLEQGNYKKAKEYFDIAEEIRLKFPNIEIYNLYKLIIKKLIDNNIKVICMQYPVRNILPLQEQLKNESYYDKITFISNEKLFKDTLLKKNYKEIFTDQFAGDFGHCTKLGNTLIAKNVVKRLEDILNLKQN